MNKPKQLLILAAAVAALGLPFASCAAETTTVTSGTATVNTTSGNVTYDGSSHDWNINNNDVLILQGGTINIRAQGTGVGNGILQATGGNISFSVGAGSRPTTLTLMSGSSIAEAVNLTLRNNSVINITGGELYLDTADSFIAPLNNTINLESGILYVNRAEGENAFVLNATGGTIEVTGGTLQLAASSGVASEVLINSAAGSTINVSAGTLYVDAQDNIQGGLSLSGGNINLENVDYNPISYTQSSGNLNLSSSEFTVNTNSELTGGNINLDGNSTLNIESGKLSTTGVNAGTGDTVNVGSSSTLGLSGGNIAADAVLNVEEGAGVNVSGSGSVLNINDNDSYLGSLNVTGGTANILNKNFNTNDTVSVNLAGGTINLDASNVSLNNENSVFSDGIVNLTNASGVTFNNGQANVASITTDTTNNTIDITGNSTFEMSGGDINETAELTIDSGSTFSLNSNSATASIDDNDAWSGTVSMSNGTLSLKNQTAVASDGKVYAQYLGTSNIDASTITFDTADAFITGGNVNLNNGSTLNFENGLSNGSILNTDLSSNAINISNSSAFSIVGGLINDQTTVSVESGSTFQIYDGAYVTLEDTDVWEGNLISDGYLTLKDITSVTDTNKTYQQAANDGNAVLNLENTSLTLNEGSFTQGGEINLSNDSNLVFQNNQNNYASVNTDAESASSLTVESGSTLTLNGGTVTENADLTINGNLDINGGDANVTIDSATDTLTGSLNLLSGNLILKEIQKNSGFAQTGGYLELNDTELTLSSDTDILDGGNLNLTNTSDLTISNGMANTTDVISTDDTVNNIRIQNSSQYDVLGGSIAENTNISIDSGSTLSVSGADVILDSATDNWNGGLSLNSGSININDFNGSNAVSTDANKTFNQSGGTLNIDSSDITLNSGSAVTSGTVNLTNSSNLDFNNGVENTATINANDTTANRVQITGNSTLTSIGGIINEAANVNIETGSTLNVNGSNSNITISGEDNWNGHVTLTNGTLNLKDGYHESNVDKTFVQTGGTLNLNGSSLQLNTADSYVEQGNINLSNNSMLTFDNGTANTANITTTDTSLNNLIVYEGATLSLVGGTINKEASVTVDYGADLNIRGANVSLNNTDTWSGAINLASGSLTLTDGLNATTTADKTYIQTGGSLYVDNSSLVLDTAESYITGGIGYLQNGGNLTIANGLSTNNMTLYANDGSDSSLNILDNSTLTMAAGSIDTAALVNIEEGSVLDIRDGVVNIDGASGDSWDGQISLNNGNLTVSNTNLDNGILRGSRGDLTLAQNAKLNLAAGSIIEANLRTTIEDTSELHITGGTAAINNGDSWRGDIYLTDGTLSYTYLTTNGNIYADGGTLNVYRTSSRGTLNVDGDSYINAATEFNLTGSATLSITDGDVYFNEGDTWADNTVVTLNGDGLFDYSDLTSGGRLQASSGNVNVHSGILNFTNASSFIAEDVELTLDEGGKIYISNNDADEGGVTFNANGAEGTNDVWNGDVELAGGTLNISGMEKSTTATSTYTQSAGTLNLRNGADLTVNEGSAITGGTVTFGNADDISSLTIANGQSDNAAVMSTSGRGDSFAVKNNSGFTHTRGTIAAGDTVRIDAGSTINLGGSSSSNLSNLYMNQGDTWSGNINLGTNYGRLYIDNISKSETGALIQTASGAVTTVTGADFNLNNASDNISGGTFNIGSGSNVATVGVSNGTIAAGANVNLISGSELDITGGSVTMNSGDTWAGLIEQTGGTLIYDGLSSNGGLNSTGGNLNLIGNAILTLDGSSTVSSGTNVSIGENSLINVEDGVNFSLDANDNWLGSIHNTGGVVNADSVNKEDGSSYVQTGVNSELNVTGEGFTLSGASDSISEGALNVGDEGGTLSDFTLSNGTIADAVTVNVFENASLIIDGGELTMSGADNVDGTLELRDGQLTLKDWILNAGYIQTGGLLDMYGSELHITDAGSSVSGAVHLNDESLIEFSSGTDNTLEIQTDETANRIDINSGNITLNGSSLINGETAVELANGAGLNVSSGTVKLNNNDIWEGTITNNSILNIDNVSKTGSYIQNNASAETTITGNFDLNSVGDEISEGSLNVGSSSNNASLTISAGSVGENANINLIDGSSIEVAGGTLTLDDADIWAGDIGTSAGTVNIMAPIDRTGSFTVNGGTANIYSQFSVSGADELLAGVINLYSLLNMEDGAEIASDVALSISRNTTINVDETSVLNINSNDSWLGNINNGGTVNLALDKTTSADSVYNQTGGVLNISDSSTLTLNEGSTITGNGEVNLSDSSGIVFNNAASNSAVIDTLDMTANNVGVTDGASLDLGEGTNINSAASVDFSGNVSISGGNLVLDTGDILAGGLVNTGATVVFDGVNKTGGYTQNDDDALLSILEDMTLGANDSITAGGLNVDGANLTLDDLSIADNIDVTLDADGQLTITSGSSVYLSSEDTVNGSIDNSGSLTVKDITLGNSYSHNNAELVMDNSKFNAQTGTVNGGSITLNNNSELNISNGGQNTIAITTDNSNNRLGITDNSTVVIESGTIVEEAILNITDGSILTLEDASVTLNDSGDTADNWQGRIEMTTANSTLELVDFNSPVGELIAEQGNLILSGNTSLSLTDGSIAGAVALNIGEEATLYLSGADLNLDSADTWGGTIVMNNENSNLTLTDMVTDDASNLIAQDGSLTLDNSTLNLTGTSQISSDVDVNIEADSTLNITGGNVTLDGLTDTWDGTLTISGGNLTLDDMTKSEGGIFQQTGGTTTILGTSFDMNNENDFVKDGTLIVGDGINEALLTVSEGKIYDDATLVIRDNAEVNIYNQGHTGDPGSGTGGLDWAGHVQVDGGRLTIDDTSKTGTLTQTGGEITITGDGFDLNRSEDRLSGGSLTVDGNLGVSAGTIEAGNSLNITDDGTITINGGNVTVNGGDIWNGLIGMSNGNLSVDGYSAEVSFNQSGGVLSILNSSDLTLDGTSSVTGGRVNIDNGSLTASAGSSINNTTVNLTNSAELTISGGNQNSVDYLSDTSANRINITGNSGLTVNSGEVLEQTVVNIENGSSLDIANSSSVTLDSNSGSADNWEGEITLGSDNATLVLKDYVKDGTSRLNATQGNFILDGTTILTLADGTVEEAVKLSINEDARLNLSGASLTLDNADTWLGTIGMDNADSTLTLTGMEIDDNANLIATEGNLVLDGTALTIGGTSNISNNVNLNIDSDSVVNLTNGDLNINDGDIWDGAINNQGGRLTIDKNTTNKTGVLTQNAASAGTTVLGTSFDLNNALDSITAGSLTVGNGVNNTLLTVSQGTVGAETRVDITENADISITGGDVTLNRNDVFAGNVSISDGDLTLDGVNKTGVLIQSGGRITIGSNFTLNNASDALNGGSLVLNQGADLTVADGTIGADSAITMGQDSEIEVAGGELTLNNNDIWSEQVTVSGGTLNIYDPQKTGSLVQTSGVTNILQDFTLNNADDSIEGGRLSIADGADLTITNGQITSDAAIDMTANSELRVSGGDVTINRDNDAWNGRVTHNGGNLTVSGYDNTNRNGVIQSSNGNLTIQDGHLTIANGSSIGNNTALNINNGTSLDVTGGVVDLNGNDSWNGDVALSDGSLNMSGVDKTTGTGSSYTQSGGSLTMDNSNLSLNDSESGISNGDVTLNNGSNLTINNGTISDSDVELNESSGLTISNGASNSANITTDETGNNVSITGDGTEVDITGGTIAEGSNVTIGAGATVNITGDDANVTLDGLTDTWDGTLTISGGNLTLDDMTKSEGGIFQQTGGTTTILGTSFDMNNENDFVKDGTLIVGDGINEALLTVSEGKIYDDATLVIRDNAEVNIYNQGHTGDPGSGTGGLDWAGHVQVDGGRLTIDDTSKTGTLTQTGGEITITGDGFDLNRSEDRLSGGSLTVDGNLGVSAGTIEAGNSLNITDDGTITINGGNVTINGGDIWNGLIDVTDGDLVLDGANKNGILTQTGGNTVVMDDFDLNNSSDLISGGSLQIQEGTLTISQGTVTADADVNINTGADISVTGNGNLSLDNDDIWNGDVNVSGGNLVISEIEDKTGSLTQTAGNISITGDFNLNNENDLIAGGNLTISNDSTLTVSDGSIESGANIDINQGSELSVAGGNVQINDGDTWNGDVSLSSGNLTIAQDKNTTADSAFNQTGGTLDLSSSLTLNEGSSITGDSIINVTGGNLVFSNNTQNNASITTDDSSALGISDGSSLTLVGGTISDGSVLDISGDLSIAGEDTTVNIGANDIWNGNISLADGNLNLTTDKITSADSTYNQTSGNLSIAGGGLTLNDGSSISGGNVSLDNGSLTASGDSSITSGNLGLENNSSLILDNNKNNTVSISTDTTSNTITINEGSGLTVVGGEITAETDLGIYGDLGINNDAIVTVDGTDVWDGKISLADGTLILQNVTQAGDFEAEAGTLKILGSNTTLGENLVVNKGVTTIIDENSTLNISGGNVTFDANTASSDDWSGDITMSSGNFTLTDNFIHETDGSAYNQTGGTLHIDNGAGLTVNDALSSITGDSVVELGNNGTLTIANGGEHSAELKTSGNSHFNLSDGSSFTTAGDTNVGSSTAINIASGSTLNVDSGNVTFDRLGTGSQTDRWSGKVNVGEAGKVTIADSNTSIGAGGNITSSNLEAEGGTLSLSNTVLTLYENTDDILKSGTVELDRASRINLASAWANENINLKTAGLIAAANDTIEANSLGGLIIDNVNGRADFTIDIYENAVNASYTTDTFDFSSIASTDGSKDAIINISDFNLIQSNPGAMIPSQTVDLGNIFNADEIGDNVKFTTTADEVVTPVNRYQLVASDANDGTYFLNVLGYNKQSFRGQVVSVAQMMNQLVVNDILFDRVMLTPQTLARTSVANRLAIQDASVLPGYEYTRHDPGVWVKSYGNFETLRMTEDLAVENSAYGSLVGVDMGTLDIGKGWSWIPTLYMGYNGAHQSFEGVSAYENVGQIGAMGTFFNRNWIASLLGYAGLYNVEMNVRGNNDQDMNYYAGTALKGAYNWRIKDKFIIQPSATVSYNFFGGPKWQSNYGQIGMTTGTLNGLNVAPGVNFIWQEETWNIFATVAYVYNCVGGVSGTASGVELPDIWLKRGYLQYGFGISKELTDRLSFFAQVILRNVGRTGIGFQGELEYRF